MEHTFHELDRFSWGDVELRTYDQAEKYEGAYLVSLAQQRFEERQEIGRRLLQIGMKTDV